MLTVENNYLDDVYLDIVRTQEEEQIVADCEAEDDHERSRNNLVLF